MSLPNYLSNIKASGIYRFVWDKSEIPGAQAETLRLVVGYSEKGEFNTPVYVKDATDFKAIFGNKSKKLERYGCYFHRLALQCLKKGPILALNLKPFKDEATQYISLNPQEGIGAAINVAVTKLYNTNRFWTLEPENLEDISPNKYLSIAATDSKDTSNSIFIRGYKPTGYDITFKNWYSSVLNGEELPTYLEGHENDLLSQYWVEVFVFRGKFTPSIASSDKLSKYFNVQGDRVELKPYITNAFGEKLDTLEALANNDASNFIRSYSGILLPEFLNSSNILISIDSQFNSDHYDHKMLMRLNQSMLYNGDIDLEQLNTTGWTKAFQASANQPFLSLSRLNPQVSDATYSEGKWSYGPTSYDVTPDFYDYDLAVNDNSEYSIKTDRKITDANPQVGDKFIFRNLDGEDVVTSLLSVEDVKINGEDVKTFAQDHNNGWNWKSEIAWVGNTITIKNSRQGILGTGTGLSDAASDLARLTRVIYEMNPKANRTIEWNGKKYTWKESLGLQGSNYADANDVTLVSDIVSDFSSNLPLSTPEQIDSYINNYSIVTKYANYTMTSKFEVGVPTIGLSVSDVEGVLDPVYSIVTFDKVVNDADWTLGGTYKFMKCVGSVSYTSAGLTPTYIEGYTYQSSKPASASQEDKLKWQNNILDVMTTYKGIRTALTSRVDIAYRYIIDTFEGFVDTEFKSRISIIAKERMNAFAICNFPAMKTFAKCDYNSFKDRSGNFDTTYITTGGNLQGDVTITRKFSLPSEENGASFVGFFTPLNMRDTDTSIKFTCPSAALVSNDFMDKYSTYFPYTVIAGTKRGRITENGLIGPDFNYSLDVDLPNLETMGVNCMVYAPGVGTYINSNQTAKQNPVTALSKINVRELCIFLQDEIEDLLRQYHWDFNTPNLRSTIKDRADVILETAKNNGGVESYINVCDTSNNTDDVINNEMFVLSTSIEPGMACGKMVQELTIYRRGGMSAVIKNA